MHKFSVIVRFICAGVLVFGIGSMMTGCTKKPSTQEVSKLEDARSAAEGAEKKLAELKQERLKLEQDLQSKQTELHKNEQERDSLKNQVK
jgi:septal ring factor EnvC (AmiA/AmiB activator)